MEPEQARAARAFLKLSVRDVAESTGTTEDTILSIETTPEKWKRGTRATLIGTLRSWYNRQGITFLEDGDEAYGLGVSYRPGVSVVNAVKKPRVVMK